MFDLASLCRASVRLSLVTLVACASLIACGSITRPKQGDSGEVRVSQVRYTMGTLLDLTVYAPSEEQGRELLDGAFGIAEGLNQELSTWIEQSPVSVLNRTRVTTPLPVGEQLYNLTSTSQRLSRDTDGAFSIVVRPLVDMWEAAARANTLPTPKDIANVKQLVSPTALEVITPRSLRKRYPGVKIETGGIGKGYAVDSMLDFLRSRGVAAAFINFGRSSLGAIGAPPGEDGWIVDVALVEGSSDARISLRDETLSVSRARGNPFVVKGRSYAHIFDPVTANPVTISRGAAIRGRSATEGEAYVKYLIIRGTPPLNISKQWSGARWMVRKGSRLEASPDFTASPGESRVSVAPE
jgi:thiamine biosynthesis lipoprotein